MGSWRVVCLRHYIVHTEATTQYASLASAWQLDSLLSTRERYACCWLHEFEQTNATGYLCATDEAHVRLKQGLANDNCLLELKEVVLNGWSDVKEDVSPKIRQ